MVCDRTNEATGVDTGWHPACTARQPDRFGVAGFRCSDKWRACAWSARVRAGVWVAIVAWSTGEAADMAWESDWRRWAASLQVSSVSARRRLREVDYHQCRANVAIHFAVAELQATGRRSLRRWQPCAVLIAAGPSHLGAF